MELPASVREINPVVDAIARGEPPPTDRAACRLALALGLLAPDGSLTRMGQAYAQPHTPDGPGSLVMCASRREAAGPLMGGRLPLQASLRRLLRLVADRGPGLVNPTSLLLPEALVRPYLAYLEDLGLLVPIGPFVEITAQGRKVAALPDITGRWPTWQPPAAVLPASPSFQYAPFRYHLVRRVCMVLIAMQGRRDRHRLQLLLDGPLTVLHPAYEEWLRRFRSTLPGIRRRAWTAVAVERFERQMPYPPWFGPWCRALLGANPENLLPALCTAPALLLEPAIVTHLPSREAWLVAAGLHWADRHGCALRRTETIERFRAETLVLPPWAELTQVLEHGGLLLRTTGDTALLLPTDLQEPTGALYPFGGPEWVAAALLEGDALTVASHSRRLAHT